MITEDIYDITIVGAGPVGLFTAFYAGLRSAKVKVIESLADYGGQPKHLYANKYLYDIPAYPRISGEALTQALWQQAQRFPIDFCFNEEVISYTTAKSADQGPIIRLQTTKGEHYSRTLILAIGNGAFTPKTINLPAAEQFVGKQIHYYTNDLPLKPQDKVVICGGGDSAVDLALELEEQVTQVYLVHRRASFRAHESSVQRLLSSTVEVLTPYLPAKLLYDRNRLKGLQLQKARSTDYLEIPANQLIINYGFTSSLGPIRHWGLEIERNALKVDSQLRTSQEGIYAVGDIANYPNKTKIIATGFGEATLAVNAALQYIYPDRLPNPIHSTDLFANEE